jgi:hypothetical protein
VSRLRSTLVLLVVAVGVTSCGGGHALTKSEFIAKADAICAKATTDANALPQPQSPPELVSLAQKTADIVESTIKKLSALKAAPKDKAVLRDNLIAPSQSELSAAKHFIAEATPVKNDVAQVEGLANQFTKDTQAIHTNDPALAAYGFKDCAKTNQ